MQGLDIAKDGTVVPNQYLVLRFDFSKYALAGGINDTINSGLRHFCGAYLPYFKVNGRKPAVALVDRLINQDNCAVGLMSCAEFVEDQPGSGKHPPKDTKGVGAHCFVLV